MDFQEYLDHFQSILDETNPKAPYDNPEFLHYTNLNWSRMNRWIKTGKLSDKTVESINSISSTQKWIIITEPWCGDAAHVVPFLQKIASENSLIQVDYELRDSPPFRIEDYLTNGGKSIPKLIIKNEKGKDLTTWGPRPEACQELYLQLKDQEAGLATLMNEIQSWYNKNAGRDIQEEISALLKKLK